MFPSYETIWLIKHNKEYICLPSNIHAEFLWMQNAPAAVIHVCVLEYNRAVRTSFMSQEWLGSVGQIPV